MKLIFLTLVVVLASTIEAKSIPHAQTRDLSDFVMNQLGLGAVWDTIVGLGSNFAGQILNEGMELIFAGNEKFNQAKEIFNTLVSDLTDHGIQSVQTASQMVQEAISAVRELLTGTAAKRDFSDFVLNTLGLQSVWDEIQGLGGDLVAQLVSEGMQLVVAGQAVVDQAKEIFAQLVSDLTNHGGNAATLVQNAIAAVAALLNKPETRMQKDFGDFLLNTLGLQGVWDEIQSLGGNFAAQLIQEGLEILASGTVVFEQAKEIFAQLVSDLTNHTANASSLVQNAINAIAALLNSNQTKMQRNLIDDLFANLGLDAVWAEIQSLGGNFVAQLIEEGLQLVMAGQAVINQAKPIFAQLVSDLTNHAGNAATLVQNAIAAVAALLNKPETRMQRNLIDNIVGALGLESVWAEIQSLGSGVIAQILAEATQLLFAGQVILDQAKEIFAQLVSDLTNHAGNAATLVQNAIAAVAALLNQQ